MVGSAGSSYPSRARTRTISRPLTQAPTQAHSVLTTPPPLSLLHAFILPSPRALRRQRQEAQQLAVDMARDVQRLSLLDVFGPTLTKAQRWAIRDALRSVYLPLLRAAAAADSSALAALAASADGALTEGQQ